MLSIFFYELFASYRFCGRKGKEFAPTEAGGMILGQLLRPGDLGQVIWAGYFGQVHLPIRAWYVEAWFIGF